ncbi:TPA: N-6 DNA methylase [Burkholderia vietnamiensis]|nr:N-6 DNA methylase [Burkholderia vietnamiensis]
MDHPDEKVTQAGLFANCFLKSTMANERITENLIRDALRLHGYGAPDSDTVVEEQKSQIDEVAKLLKAASKTGNGGRGAPEFIITAPSTPDFIIIIECKASVKHHASDTLDRPADFAVDGALHYARYLSKAYNVIAIAASGQTKSALRISTFLCPKGEVGYKPLTNEASKDIEEIIPWDDYVRHGSFDPLVAKSRQDDLMAFSRDLHEFMRNHAKLTESDKPLLVSGTLIALKNKAFAKSFGDYTAEDLQKEWMHVIRAEIQKADIPNSKKNSMTQPYSGIAVHPELGKSTPRFPRGVFYELIKMLDEKVWPFVSVYHDFDVVGRFYGEFLKYTGGDKKALGIVLTPRHITELFALLANVSKDTKVLDICAGTGGFLISAMQQMMRHAVTEQEREHIRKECLIGVEQQPNMYALCASNMILRGDGKANLYQGSCFDRAITKAMKEHGCSVGMLNPPYSQGDEDLHELVFVKHALDCLRPGGTGIAIIPLPKVIAPHPAKAELLQSHTLEAVMTMPHELFYPVGRATCIVIFTAHRPHRQSDKKTWFSYWKDDGFVKTKHLGRVDLNGKWEGIRDSWVEAYRNRDDIPGFSIKRRVGPDDEWCAEAYMETDYDAIGEPQLATSLKRYLAYRLMEKEAFCDLASGDGNEEAS